MSKRPPLPARLSTKLLTHLIRRVARRKTRAVVQAGPFRGMRYLERCHGSSTMPKWLGVYERELHGCIEEAIAEGFETVVDIGAAEGYYAVGLALRMPQARVIAFESEPAARKMLRALIALNDVGNRVTVEGPCTPRALAATLKSSGKTLLVCDSEGAEATLLDPVRIPQLRSWHILVELHEFVIPGISEEIRERFRASHSITHIWQEERERSEFPYTSVLTRTVPRSIDFALTESRPCKMAWYWMRPNKPLAKEA